MIKRYKCCNCHLAINNRKMDCVIKNKANAVIKSICFTSKSIYFAVNKEVQFHFFFSYKLYKYIHNYAQFVFFIINLHSIISTTSYSQKHSFNISFNLHFLINENENVCPLACLLSMISLCII